jgi:hypothetical protein
MVDLFIPEQEDDAVLRKNFFNYDKVGTLDVLGATLQETIYYNPASALSRMGEQYMFKDEGQILSSDEYKESEFFREGIEVGDEGISTGEANILAKRYDERGKFQSVLRRSKGGIGLGAMQFGTALVGSMLDPLNIGSAFVPVVREARIAGLTARFGKSGGRFLAGAVDGAALAVPLEVPINIAARMEQDQDYTIMDSLLNVTIGGVLGGGFHVAGGKIGDAIKRTTPETREQALRTSVGQLVQNGKVEIKPIFDVDRKIGPYVASEKEGLFRALKAEPVETQAEVPASLEPLRNRPKSLTEFIKENGGIDSNDRFAGDFSIFMGNEAGDLVKSGGKSAEEMAKLADEAGYFSAKIDDAQKASTVDELLSLTERDFLEGKTIYSGTDPEVAKYREAVDLFERAERQGVDVAGKTDAQLFDELQRAEASGDAVSTQAKSQSGLTPQQFDQTRETIEARQNDIGELEPMRAEAEGMEAEANAARDPDVAFVDQDNAELEAEIEQFDDIGLVSEKDKAELAALKELQEKSDKAYPSVTKQAGICMLGAIQ